MSSSKEIQKIVDFVEEHIEERLSVDTLADVGGFSKFQLKPIVLDLHRVFLDGVCATS